MRPERLLERVDPRFLGATLLAITLRFEKKKIWQDFARVSSLFLKNLYLFTYRHNLKRKKKTKTKFVSPLIKSMVYFIPEI